MDPAPQQQPPRPTLEELLRFKRTERPTPEFWDDFDRGLRQKQLAALMQPPARGWRLRSPLLRGLRWAAPAAAAIAVAVLFNSAPPAASPTAPFPLATALPRTPAFPAKLPAAQPATHPLIAHAETAIPAASPSATTASAPLLAQTREPASTAVHVAQEQSLPWTSAAMVVREALRLQPARSQPVRNGTSSWTSALAEAAPATSWSAMEPRLLELTALDLRVTTEYAGNLASVSSRPLPATDNLARADDERDYRDMVSRIGVTGSSLSIKF